MKILALDPAQLCGFAWHDATAAQFAPHSGTWDLARGKASLAEQHVRLASYVRAMHQSHGIEIIASENAGFGSHNPAVQASHNERLGCLRMIAQELGVELVTFQPTSIKAYATGSGRADKQQMISACKRILNLRPIDDNECDAIWICHMAAHPHHWPKPAQKKPKALRTKAAKKSGRLF